MAYRKEGEKHWDKLCTIFAEPESNEDVSSEFQTGDNNVPVIIISSSLEGTPPKPKRSIGRRLFGGLMGNRGKEGQSSIERRPVARHLVTNPYQNDVLGNPNWVIGTPPRFSVYGDQQFNGDQFSSSGRAGQTELQVDGDSNSSLPSLRRIQSSPQYETWPFFPAPNIANNNGFASSVGGGVGDGVGSSSSIPF